MCIYMYICVYHYVCWSSFYENKVLHRHVSFVFLPNPPIVILELPNCSSHGWLIFLKRCYWLVRQKYNKHVTMQDLISA